MNREPVGIVQGKKKVMDRSFPEQSWPEFECWVKLHVVSLQEPSIRLGYRTLFII